MPAIKSPIILETDRLVLRLWHRRDLEPLAALNADPAIMEFMPETLTLAQSETMMAHIMAHFEQHGFGFWAVEVKGQIPFIGFVGLSIPKFEAAFTPCVEIGWRLAHSAWGKGYASEAARACIDHAFAELTLDELISFTVTSNMRSRAVMERIGMTHDAQGDFDHPRLPEGHPLRPHVLYRYTRAIYERDYGAYGNR